jgi:hypothetical protein
MCLNTFDGGKIFPAADSRGPKAGFWTKKTG